MGSAVARERGPEIETGGGGEEVNDPGRCQAGRWVWEGDAPVVSAWCRVGLACFRLELLLPGVVGLLLVGDFLGLGLGVAPATEGERGGGPRWLSLGCSSSSSIAVLGRVGAGW